MALLISANRLAALKDKALAASIAIIEAVCQISASSGPLLQSSIASKSSRLSRLVAARNTPAAFNWMLECFQFQGISDAVASGYLETHGYPTWRQIKRQLKQGPACSLLKSYWTYEDCRYDKARRQCSHIEAQFDCPVPTHFLRNGHLNQLAFSLFLFVRDIAGSDFFGWIEKQLDKAACHGSLSNQEALIGPMRHIYGLSDKVLTMALSSLLMAAPDGHPDWFLVGSEMIVVDRLVHNFLARTGVLARHNADHPYGPRCYGKGGCADLLKAVAGQIDARQFDPAYPANFPRFVQHAIWRYCAADSLDICNGNRIDDRKPCSNAHCEIRNLCERVVLKPV